MVEGKGFVDQRPRIRGNFHGIIRQSVADRGSPRDQAQPTTRRRKRSKPATAETPPTPGDLFVVSENGSAERGQVTYG